MILDFNRFILFYSNNSWILTKEKVASSYLKDRFDYDWIEVDINNFSFEIHNIPLHHRSNFDMPEEKYIEYQQKFESDWNNLISNNNKSTNFIFLLRNPINKFVTGWVQDSIMRKVNDDYLYIEQERLSNFFEKEEVDSFINYVIDTINQERMLGPRYFPDVQEIPLKYKDIFEEFCFPKNNDFFKNDIETFLNLTTTGHPAENLYLVWRLCFEKSINFDCNNVHIIDIDLQDIDLTLSKKFGIEFAEKNVNYNKRGDYLKNKAYIYLSQNHFSVNSILQIEMLFWYEIISKLYPKELYESDTLPPLLKPLSSYKKKYFIPEHLDFYNFQVHMNWYRYEPKDVQLNYID
jgi:hypothetical protein